MNYGRYSFIPDIDGTVCPIKKKREKYEDLVPYTPMIEKTRFYRGAGAEIVFFTSRSMSSYDRDLGLINKNTARIPIEWLDKWNIPYGKVFYDKPWPGHKGFYMNDRSVRPDKFLIYTPKELAERCEASRAKKD